MSVLGCSLVTKRRLTEIDHNDRKDDVKPTPRNYLRSPARRVRALVGASAAVAILVGLPAAASGDNPGGNGASLQELQRKRDQVRSEKAAQASKVNALQATDAEVTSALSALNANVSAQQDRVEEAERAVTQAENDRSAAEAAQAQAQAELDQIKVQLRESAVEAYVSLGSSEPMSSVGVDDVNDAVNKRTLLSVKANEKIDLVERFRSTQEDLAIQRAAAADAEQRATQNKAVVQDRLGELNAAYEKQQAFAAQVDQRLEASLAEADSLAAIDTQLSGTIAAKQAEIAKAIAAQRAADEARAAQRAAQNRAALTPRSSGGGSAASGGGGGAVAAVTSRRRSSPAAERS